MKPNFLEIVKRIPKDSITTYKIIGEIFGVKDFRKVGWGLHKNNNLKEIECFRVINSDFSLGGYKLGKKKKEELLRESGFYIENNQIKEAKIWKPHIFNTFICYELPEAVKKIVKEIQEELNLVEGSLQDYKKAHITIKFFNNKGVPVALEWYLRNKKYLKLPLEAKIKGIDYFSKPSYNVIFLDVTLNSPFINRPHITIARVPKWVKIKKIDISKKFILKGIGIRTGIDNERQVLVASHFVS